MAYRKRVVDRVTSRGWSARVTGSFKFASAGTYKMSVRGLRTRTREVWIGEFLDDFGITDPGALECHSYFRPKSSPRRR